MQTSSLHQVDVHWNNAIKADRHLKSDYQLLVGQMGGKEEADKRILTGLVEQDLKEGDLPIPGSFL